METNLSASLSGTWEFALDPERKGIRERWFDAPLPDRAALPGTTDDNRKGTGREEPNLRNLNRRCSFMGWAWYRKTVAVPDSFAGKHLTVFLERCLWETSLWIDGKFVWMEDSLAAPHCFNVTGLLPPGEHTLALLVDNSNLKDEDAAGADVSDRRDLTSGRSDRFKHNCGGHHTMFLMPTNWNGILGRMELRAEEPFRIGEANVFPQRDLSRGEVRLVLANDRAYIGAAQLVCRLTDEAGNELSSSRTEISADGSQRQKTTVSVDFPEGMTRWSEFTPVLYRLALTLEYGGVKSEKSVEFGLRFLEAKDSAIWLNGNRVFLRGSVENCTFPLSFAPPAEDEAWERIFRTAKSYGLNHFRFHTFCPPEAAFRAADRYGFLLQIELGGTSCPEQTEDPADTAYLQHELERILAAYGNHPSFGMLSMGNEQLVATDRPGVLNAQQKILSEKVRYGQEHDPRHLYTCTSHPCTHGRPDDYFVSAWTMKGWDAMTTPGAKTDGDCFLTGIRWGGPDPMNTSYFCTEAPTLDRDYDRGLAEPEKPFISHEVGQWEVFPDVGEIPKFTGVLEPGNLELIRDDLEKKGLLPLVTDFVRASGKLSLMLYRSEIETMLKSRKLSGFQMLDLTDYPGQGTSTVGLLDAFWDSKGLCEPEEYRRFCGSLIPLLRTEKFVYVSGETVKCAAEAANYRTAECGGAWSWSIAENGRVLAQGGGNAPVPAGGVSALGAFEFPVPASREAHRLTVSVRLENAGAENSWDLWTYPDEKAAPDPAVAVRWDEETKRRLAAGESLLFLPEKKPGDIPAVFTTTFWNPQMKKQTGTFGLLCDPALPALRGFPNEGYTQWQWWDVLRDGFAADVTGLPVSPSVRVIDSFTANRSLALLFEASVGAGRLLVCTAGLAGGLEDRPAARWLRACLLRYLRSGEFRPSARLTEEELDRLFR